MNETEIRAGVIAALKGIAPEIDELRLDAGAPLRDQIDLDSMDWLNVILALHERFHADIPEADYGRLATLDEIVAYLKARMGNGRQGNPATSPQEPL
ncbi:MAG: hypothetical protein Fur0039_02170 [Rhodocyclaceae bacterium]